MVSILPMTSQMLVRPAVNGSALEQRRLALGLSREALGARAGGIASATVRRLEKCEVRPHPSTVVAILAASDEAERA